MSHLQQPPPDADEYEVVWMFKNRIWVKMPWDLSRILEEHFQASKTVFFLQRTENYENNEESMKALVWYRFDLDTGTQLNTMRMTERPICRIILPWPRLPAV